MKHLTPFALLLLLLCPFMSYETEVKTMTIYFEKDKPYFNAGEAEKLSVLKTADFVSLKSHTDNDGSDGYNIELSKRRLEAVKNYVHNLDKGIKIETAYYGERSPLNPNANESEKTKNRRVEVTYITDPLLRTPVPQQVYEIDNSQYREIICQHGTKVAIPAGAFGDKKVKLIISEYYTAAEIMAANLTTKSGDRPIETAGMINVSAEIDGQPVQALKPLQYKFPRKNTNQDFRLFVGARDNGFNMNWNLEKTEPQLAVAERPKQASTRLLGWDSCEVLSEAPYSAYLQGKGIDSFWYHRKMAAGYLQQGCLLNGAAVIGLNNKGQIISITTNYDAKNMAWAKELKKFIRDYFPESIETGGSTATISIKFGKYNTSNIITGNGAVDGFSMGQFGKEYVADYETDNIILTTSKMGWINCDRFMNYPTLSTYKVYTDADCNVRLLMKKYRSFFFNEFRGGESKAHQEHNTEYGFYRIPADEEVVVISTKKVQGTIYLAIERTKVSPQPFTNFNYKPVTQAELETAINNLSL